MNIHEHDDSEIFGIKASFSWESLIAVFYATAYHSNTSYFAELKRKNRNILLNEYNLFSTFGGATL